jgi:hypothetical protein
MTGRLPKGEVGSRLASFHIDRHTDLTQATY